MSEDTNHEGGIGLHSPVPSRERSLVARVGQAVLRAWRPIPVETPAIDVNLQDLSGVERVAEVLRYNLLSLEFAVSPKGGLRAWLKLNVLAASVLAIPALFLVPVVTLLLSGFADWTQFLVQIAGNLLQTAISIFLLILVVALGRAVLSKGVFRTSSRGRR